MDRKEDNTRNNHDGFDAESILEPRKGTFMPWSDGPRACPGKKFAQVEFVAVIVTILRDYRLRPPVMNRETEEDARRRILDVVKDSRLNFSLQMRHPTRAMVSLVRA
jgi:cytochrome P450